jgi:SSS family solute:Na+ symporter
MLKGLENSISALIILGIVAIGLWAGLKKKTVTKGDAFSDYFLAGKSLS